MIRITASIGAEWGRANERAIEQARQGRRPVYQGTHQGHQCYACESSDGTGAVYQVTILNLGKLEARCDCPHGRRNEAAQRDGEQIKGHCWHAAASLFAETVRLSDVARWRQTYGAKPAPEQRLRSREEVERKMARFARQ